MLKGKTAAVALTEPMISVAEKNGLQRIIETHFLGSDIGAPELVGEPYAREEFETTYEWMTSWDLIDRGFSYSQIVASAAAPA